VLGVTRRELLSLLGVGSLAGGAGGFRIGLAAPKPLSGAGGSARLSAFPLGDVRLLDGPFLEAERRDLDYLVALQPDRLLHNFRVNAGLEPKAPVYGGWESEEPWVNIRCHGHTLGHYLSAVSLMYASTGDARMKQRADYIVDELQRCQNAGTGGLVCAFPDGATQLENAVAGRPFIGVPWYTMHKIFAGLRDAHLHAESAAALEVLAKLADWSPEGAAAAADGSADDADSTEEKEQAPPPKGRRKKTPAEEEEDEGEGGMAMLHELHRNLREAGILLEFGACDYRAGIGLRGRVGKRLAATVLGALLVGRTQIEIVLKREVLAPGRGIIDRIVQFDNAIEGILRFLLAFEDIDEECRNSDGGDSRQDDHCNEHSRTRAFGIIWHDCSALEPDIWKRLTTRNVRRMCGSGCIADLRLYRELCCRRWPK